MLQILSRIKRDIHNNKKEVNPSKKKTTQKNLLRIINMYASNISFKLPEAKSFKLKSRNRQKFFDFHYIKINCMSIY